MRSRIPSLALVTLALAACGGGGPAGPPGLAYGVPATPEVTYITGDTATMDIDAGGQAMQAFISSQATLGISFARAADGVQVTMTVEDLDARMSNPMASATADESGIQGPLVFTLDRRGAASVVSQPTVNETVSQFFQPLALAHQFFPRLPGRGAGVGESWTDTIRMEGEPGPGRLNSVSVMTFTVAGDSVVDGRSLLKIHVEGTTETSARGVTTGMDFSQTGSGTVTGWYLWDLQRGLLVESYAEADGRGSMEVAAAPFPLGMRLRSQSRVRLQSGM